MRATYYGNLIKDPKSGLLEGGSNIKFFESWWVIIRKFPVEDMDGNTYNGNAYWGGRIVDGEERYGWSLEWEDDMLMYDYRSACKVAEDVNGVAFNFADYLRYDRFMVGQAKFKPQHKATERALEKLSGGSVEEHSESELSSR